MHLSSITIPDGTDRFSKIKGLEIKLQPGLNFIVGENGIGKSSIISLVQGQLTKDFKYTMVGAKKGETLNTYHFDTEKMNPRKSNYVESIIDVASRFSSHGETISSCLKAIKQVTQEKGSFLILIDEPESGLSPWTQREILKLFEDLSKKNQFLIATHSTVMTGGDVGTVAWLRDGSINYYYDPPKTFSWR